ncbi:MAG: S-layer homology domain-containing protein [Oscillospiraceae bacterium]
MKKRLLSMLMAVLMIASLVPATALAATTCTADKQVKDHDATVIIIKKDAAASQPGIKAVYCEKCNVATATISAFKTSRNQCDVCKNFKTVEVQKATCDQAGLTVTYCADCGKAISGTDAYKFEKPTGHVYGDFTVVKAPTCKTAGWGYAICKVCGAPEIVNGNDTAAINKMFPASMTTEQKANTLAMYQATNPKHADKTVLVPVEKDGVDAAGTKVIAADEMTHFATVTLKNKNVVYIGVDAKGNFNSHVTVNANAKAYTGDKVCPDCGVKAEGGEWVSANLNNTHNMSGFIAGELPGVDKEDGTKYDGVTDSWYCVDCGKRVGGEVIPYDTYYPKQWRVGAVDATCTKDGKTGDLVTLDAKGNEVVLEVSEKIDALGHNWVAGDNVAPTCTKAGKNYDGLYVCDRDGCNAEKYNAVATVPATGHNYEFRVLVDATCQHGGLSVKACTVCGELKVDSAYATAKVAHVAGDPVNAKEATCTEVGYTGDTYCKWCNTAMEKGKEIPMKEHTPEEVAAVAATCTETGLTAGSKCSVCGEVLTAQEVVPELGHDFKDGKCTRCDAVDPNYKPEVKNPFTDVKEGDAFYEDILWAADKNIVDGIKADDGTMTFQANGKLTRAQVVQMLWNANGKPEAKAAADFSDVAADAWYAKAVAWAVEAGVINGMGDGTFAPNAECTRAQFVKMLWVINGSPKADAADFSDVAADAWYAQAVAWAAAQEVTLGDGEGHFLPGDSCTRGQAVAFLHRAPSLTVTAAE